MDWYNSLLKKLLDAPEISPRGSKCREMRNVRLNILGELYETAARSTTSGRNWEYLMAELSWYFKGDVKASGISNYAEMWSHLADSKGEVNSNYGYLTLYDTCYPNPHGKLLRPAIDFVIHKLMQDPDTRQATLPYPKPWHHTDTKDFICTQLQQFHIRDGKLHSTAVVRSSDAILGLSYDMPWWSVLQQAVANTLRIPNGSTEALLLSSHLYEKHYKLAERMVDNGMAMVKLRHSLTIEDIRFRRDMWTPKVVEEEMMVVRDA